LEQFEVNIEGVKTKDEFDIMDIMDDSDIYLELFGID